MSKGNKTTLERVMDLKNLIHERKNYIKRQMKSKSETKRLGQQIKAVNDEIEYIMEKIEK